MGSPLEGEDRSRILVGDVQDLITVCGPDNTIRYISPSVEKILGYKPEELVGVCVPDLLHPEELERATEDSAKVLSDPSYKAGPYRYRHKDGSWVYLESSTRNLVEDPRVRGVVINSRDVTETVRAQEALRRARDRYRALVEQVPAVNYIIDPTSHDAPRRGAVTYMSPQIERMLGYQPGLFEEDPRFWDSLIHPDDFERAAESGDPFEMEYRMRHLSGHWVWVRDDAAPVRDEAGRLLFWQGVLVDISRRKGAGEIQHLDRGLENQVGEHAGRLRAALLVEDSEELLRMNMERFRSLVRNASDVITILDAEGHVEYQSPAIERVLGYKPGELVGKDAFYEVHPEDVGWVKNKLAKALEEPQGRASMWYRVRDKEGSWHHFDAVVTNLLDEPSVRGIVVNSRDITELKEIEKELEHQATQAALRADVNVALTEGGSLQNTLQRCAEAMVRHIGVALARIWTFDEEEGVLELLASAGLHETIEGPMNCVPAGEELGHVVRNRRPNITSDPFNEPRVEGKEERAHVDGLTATASYPLIIEDRVVGVISMFARHPLTERALEGMGSVAATIAQGIKRKRVEAELEQSEELYRTVVEQAAENIFLVDVETGRILEANAALHRSLGYAPEELQHITLHDIDAHEPESVDLNIERILAERHRFIGERKYRRKDGTLMDVEVNVGSISYGGREAMCIVAHDVTERKRMENNLRHSLSVLLALYEAGQLLVSSLDLEEIGPRLLEIMRGVAHLAAAVICLRDERGELRVRHAAGPEEVWTIAHETSEAREARRSAMETGQPLSFRLDACDPDVVPPAGLCLPLRVLDRPIGVLEVYGPVTLAERMAVEVLTSLASQAGSVLENARLYGELAERERRLEDLIGKLMAAQEEERRRVAYEVHDGLAQMAANAHQHLQTFAWHHAPVSEKGREDLKRVLGVVRRTVREARKIIANLRPTVLDDFGLSAALRQTAEELRDDGWTVEYEERLGEERLPVAVETALFRVAQEALTNARKHAQTDWARLELLRRGNVVILRVEDRGKGFDPEALEGAGRAGERVGLSSMRERITLLDGEIEVRSRPGEGTSVTVQAPLPGQGGPGK